MKKGELIDVASSEADLTRAAAEKALNAILEAVIEAVAKGETVNVVGFGTFRPAKRAGRAGRNPQTGEEIRIAATTVPRFTAGSRFKAAVAGKRPTKE